MIGGTAAKDQITALRQGVDIVVATPGRLEDLISTKELLLNQCRFFILDEADGLLKAGYEPLINRLHGQVRGGRARGRREGRMEERRVREIITVWQCLDSVCQKRQKWQKNSR